jgi:glucosamine--fructose-6-phosphate aminotransferase (isomerizing)
VVGIAAYVGRREAAPILLRVLAALDASGRLAVEISTLNGNGVERRQAARLVTLEGALARQPVHGACGIARARPSAAGGGAESGDGREGDEPCCGELALACYGIIENGEALRALLASAGHRFESDDDAETLAHLIADAPGETLEARIRSALERVEGSCSFAATSAAEPGTIVVAQEGTSLFIGVGEQECFVASEVAPLTSHTRVIVHLREGDLAVVTAGGYRIVERRAHVDDDDADEDDIDAILQRIERGGYRHSLWKEIAEQAVTVERGLSGRLAFAEGTARLPELERALGGAGDPERVVLVGAGSSWHAALAGRRIVDVLARMPAGVELASEFRYAPRRGGAGVLTIALSKSGESPDTVVAARQARALGSRVLALVNAPESTLAREADAWLDLRAGGELGVAGTKTFTAQLVALLLVGLALGRRRGLSREAGSKFLDQLGQLPEQVEQVLGLEAAIRALARRCGEARHALVLGRGAQRPVALEGALQLTEVARMHAEECSALEMQHGPIRLVEAGVPVVFLVPRDEAYPKVLATMREVKARGGLAVAITNEENGARDLADASLVVPAAAPLLLPILTVVPLQSLAYHIAALRGYEVDRPASPAANLTRRDSVPAARAPL